MKPILIVLIVVAFLRGSIAAPPAPVRTVTDLNLISTQALQRSISPKFYKSLLISPIQGWIAVRGSVVGAHLSGRRVFESELDGGYDPLALQVGKDFNRAPHHSIESPHFGAPV